MKSLTISRGSAILLMRLTLCDLLFLYPISLIASSQVCFVTCVIVLSGSSARCEGGGRPECQKTKRGGGGGWDGKKPDEMVPFPPSNSLTLFFFLAPRNWIGIDCHAGFVFSRLHFFFLFRDRVKGAQSP